MKELVFSTHKVKDQLGNKKLQYKDKFSEYLSKYKIKPNKSTDKVYPQYFVNYFSKLFPPE